MVHCACRVCSSGKAEDRVVTSKKAKYAVSSVRQPVPADRVGNAYKNTKHADFSIATVPAA